YTYFKNLINNVASPRNDRNPPTSVQVVTKTVEASAGSAFSLFRISGITVPEIPAITRLRIIARAMMPPINNIFEPKPNQTQTTTATTSPFANPLANPTKSSLSNTRRPFSQVTSPSASPRTITANV